MTQIRKQTIRFKLKAICAEYGVEIIYAFGSKAGEIVCAVSEDIHIGRDEASDVDIAVKPQPGMEMSVRVKSELAMKFEDLFGVGTVDLVSLPEADPFLAVNIIRGERLYAVDERTADEYDLFILRRAGDLSRFERQRLSGVLAR